MRYFLALCFLTIAQPALANGCKAYRQQLTVYGDFGTETLKANMKLLSLPLTHNLEPSVADEVEDIRRIIMNAIDQANARSSAIKKTAGEDCF